MSAIGLEPGMKYSSSTSVHISTTSLEFRVPHAAELSELSDRDMEALRESRK